jgi:hypothetical protein
MLAELYHRDTRGFVSDRAVADKLMLTCRYVAILMATILKSKGIPARVRSGNAPYFSEHKEFGKVSWDHWITQYWNDTAARWVSVDVDGSLSLVEAFDPYDMPDGTFDFPGQAWLDVRSGKVDPNYFFNAGGERGLVVVAWSLFYDFHCLMNEENIYLHIPKPVSYSNFPTLTVVQLKEIDEMAMLMTQPDAHFSQLKKWYETKRDWRELVGGLL